jgi:HEAT repeat protein
MTFRFQSLCGLLLLAAAVLFSVFATSSPAQTATTNQEPELIRLVQSNAPAGERAVACKLLAIYGSDKAVPALAALLSDEQLASWARIALEVIPGPAADRALREAAAHLRGRLLVGVVNSIGVRRDPQAVGVLIQKLDDSDPEVASAAAVALGRIGGSKASSALVKALSRAPETVRPAVAEGCIRCAEDLRLAGKNSAAVKVYEAVRKGSVPKQKMLEATRGLILARGDKGIPLLAEQLTSPDKARFAIGLRTARELPGKKATEAVITQLRQAPAERQPMLLLALADRNDPGAMPAILEAARTGSPRLRLTAVNVIEKSGDRSTVPVLIETAVSGDAQLEPAAVAALVRLPGEDVDGDLLARLRQSAGKQREVLVRVTGQRRTPGAFPLILASADNPDAGVRSAAFQALGALAGADQIPRLIELRDQRQEPRERAEVENALLATCGRSGAAAVPHLGVLIHSSDSSARGLGLRALAAAGGPEALKAVIAALKDPETEIQDEAVRTLATWPNTWPEDAAVAEPLLGLARAGARKSHQVLALRGYLQYVQGDRKLAPGEKVAKLRDILPLIERPEEKRLAISVADEISDPGALELLLTFAQDETVSREAYSSVVKLAGKPSNGLNKGQRTAALQAVVDKCPQAPIRQRAEERLKALE